MKKVLLFILLIMLMALSACGKKDNKTDEIMLFQVGSSVYYSDLKSPMKLISDQHQMSKFKFGEDERTLFFEIDRSLYCIDTKADKVKVNVIGEYDGDYTLSKNGNLLTYYSSGVLYQINYKKSSKKIIASRVAYYAISENCKQFAYVKASFDENNIYYNLYFKRSAKAQPELLEENALAFCASSDLNAYLIFKEDGSLIYLERGKNHIKVASDMPNIYHKDEFCLNDFIFQEEGILKAFSNSKITDLGESGVIDYYQSRCYFINDDKLYYFDGNKKYLVDNEANNLVTRHTYLSEDISSIVYSTENGIFVTKGEKAYKLDAKVISNTIFYSNNGKYIYYIDKTDTENNAVIKRRVGKNGTSIIASGKKYDGIWVVDDACFYNCGDEMYKDKKLIDTNVIPNEASIIKYKNNYFYIKDNDLYIIWKGKSQKVLSNVGRCIIAGSKLIIFQKNDNEKYDVYYYNNSSLVSLGNDIETYTVFYKNTQKYTYIKYVTNF